MMRTTLTIDDSVFQAVRKVAVRRQQSLGAAVTDLLREALKPKLSMSNLTGLPTMPIQPGAGHASLEIVNALRDEFT